MREDAHGPMLPSSSGAVDGPPWPVTPDGRYFMVRGKLWRAANPQLTPEQNHRWVIELMNARRGLKDEGDAVVRAALRVRVDQAKVALGERGPVWWSDGAPDYNRRWARNTPYAQWASGYRLSAQPAQPTPSDA